MLTLRLLQSPRSNQVITTCTAFKNDVSAIKLIYVLITKNIVIVII